MKAVKCPVCCGSGKYIGTKCHGCNGKGWIEIHEEINWRPNDFGPMPITEPWRTTETTLDPVLDSGTNFYVFDDSIQYTYTQ